MCVCCANIVVSSLIIIRSRQCVATFVKFVISTADMILSVNRNSTFYKKLHPVL